MRSVLKRVQQQHNHFVEGIYHAAVEPSAWQTVLGQLVEVLDGRSARMLFMDGTATTVHASHTVNVDEGYLRQYVEHYVNACPWRPELRHKPKGRLYSTYLDFSNDQHVYHRSEFYNDWARPQGIEHGICGNVIATHDYAVQLLVQRTAEPGHFTREETDAVNRLLPHLQRALTLHYQMENDRRSRESIVRAKQRSSQPCIVLDEQLRVVHMDEAIPALLTRFHTLRIVRGRVSLDDSLLNSQLQRQLKGCAAAARGEWQQPGPGMRLQTADGLLELHVYPIHPAHKGVFSDGDHYVALYLNDPGQRYALDEQLVRHYFGLSPTELRLAEALCNGQTLEEFALCNGTTLATVRTQSKQLLAKSGVRRQAEVVKRLMPYLRLK